MRRKNAKEVVVNNPGKGLLKNLPPDLQKNQGRQYLTEAKNVRAEDGSLKSAPGYERVQVTPKNLNAPANLIHQANITSADEEDRKVPIIGTETSLYTVEKRSTSYVCPSGVDGNPCTLKFAATSDSGNVGADIKAVANAMRKKEPELVLHAGDLVYADGGSGIEGADNYEEQVAQYYSWAMGQYGGVYTGGDENYFFPVLGNHDWDDGPGTKYLGFFDLPGNEQYYDLKKGPVHFFFLDSYGSGPASTGPDGNSINGTGAAAGKGQSDLSSTGPMATWLKMTMATSDCPIRIVVMHHPPYTSETLYHPGYSVLRWPWREWGTDLLITGHSHAYERIIMPDGCTMVTIGLGGHSKRAFNSTAIEGSQVRYSDKYGFLYGEVSDSTFTCQFIDVDGGIQDTFSKGVSRPVTLCYRGDFERQGRTLVVEPTTKKLEVNGKFPFKAYIQYANGLKEEVTNLAQWSTSDSKIAIADSTGLVEAKEVGSCEVIARHEGLVGISDLTVRFTCVDDPIEAVVVFDNSLSMSNSAGSAAGRTRLDRAKEGLALFLDEASRGLNDRVALISYNGYYKDQIPRVTVHTGLTDDIGSLYADVRDLQAIGDTGIADALAEARALINDEHEDGFDKVIILFTDGATNIVSSTLDPNRVLPLYDGAGQITNGNTILSQALTAATAQATAIKADGTTLIVIGYDIKRYATYYNTIKNNWASTGFYYDAETGDQLVEVFSELFLDLCEAHEEASGDVSAGTNNP